jgi:hypothetical protein
MKEFQGISAAANIAWGINKSLGSDSPMMRMIKAQRELQDKLTPFKNHEIFRTIASIQNMLPRYEETGILSVMKNIRQINEMMPSGTMTAIMAINKQNQHLFNSTRSILDTVPSNAAFAHFNSLQHALNGISRNVTAVAATNRQWELVDRLLW